MKMMNPKPRRMMSTSSGCIVMMAEIHPSAIDDMIVTVVSSRRFSAGCGLRCLTIAPTPSVLTGDGIITLLASHWMLISSSTRMYGVWK